MSSAKIKYIIAMVTYGTIGLVLHYISASSEFVVLCRGIIGTMTITLVSLLRKHSPEFSAVKENLPTLLLSGLCLGLNWIFLFAAYRETSDAVASLCNYTAPVIVLIITAITGGEKFTLRTLISVLGAMLGIIMVSGVLGESGSQFNLKGLALGFAAAGGFVGLVLCNRRLRDIDSMDKSIVQLGTSAVVVLPYVLYTHGGHLPQPDALSTALILLLGVFHTGFAYILYFDSLGKIPVESMALLGYLEPVVSCLISALILREGITPIGIIGAVLILGAAVYSEIGQLKKVRQPRAESLRDLSVLSKSFSRLLHKKPR